jgi:hypothetical protein
MSMMSHTSHGDDGGPHLQQQPSASGVPMVVGASTSIAEETLTFIEHGFYCGVRGLVRTKQALLMSHVSTCWTAFTYFVLSQVAVSFIRCASIRTLLSVWRSVKLGVAATELTRRDVDAL